eukprot:4146246-Prymnesium_polylepis.1
MPPPPPRQPRSLRGMASPRPHTTPPAPSARLSAGHRRPAAAAARRRRLVARAHGIAAGSHRSWPRATARRAWT